MKKILKIGIWYFMICIIFLMLFAPFMIIEYINSVRTSGFATADIWKSFIIIFGLFIGLSLLIPICREMYYKLPWLFAFVRIFFINTIILSVALLIINYGYEVQNEARHTLFFIIMLCEIILGRVLMCIYFNKKKVEYIGGDLVG